MQNNGELMNVFRIAVPTSEGYQVFCVRCQSEICAVDLAVEYADMDGYNIDETLECKILDKRKVK